MNALRQPYSLLICGPGVGTVTIQAEEVDYVFDWDACTFRAVGTPIGDPVTINRDGAFSVAVGDEHVERRDINVYTNPRSTPHVPTTNRYPCSSDRYDHTHVYAHGDDGESVKE